MKGVTVHNLARAIYESSYNKEGVEFDHVVEKSLELIKRKHMLSKAPLILAHIQKKKEMEKGMIRAKVTTTQKLKDYTRDEVEDFIKKKYKKEKVILTLVEDPKLLGGIKIEVGDEVIDTTLKHKIDQLHNYLMTN